MGCGNSTSASTAAGPSESAKDVPSDHLLVLFWFWAHRQDDSSVDDEKRRNYGGVYVGLPADLSNVATGQTASTQKE
ncbi:overexpressed in colon carcinoma 1 protein homolog isoform X1 [Carassius auratus]|uniref:Overexpressed in colon carcinoma 1 protein homolog isoform X1 n=1 Tax=Carassius auratus TaxID=7957 RepID=A0A6P6M2I2_CARAU|nr:overexpressed in colon carcinoma 1 protein homolog isoform X1 [Carassius auratus]XP_052410990.1 overexpressed in colon carcinoma 1 protein homolog isoform X1 [Carassius gibelio]